MKYFKDQFRIGCAAGIQKGWHGFVWMLKILVPISFLTMLLSYSGWLTRIDFLLEPLMRILYLPSIAALPMIIGLLTGIYGGIAAMVMLPLSHEHMTLIAIFLLISHNLVQEGIVQAKSGMHPITATVWRLFASWLTVVTVAQFLSLDASSTTDSQAVSLTHTLPFLAILKAWSIETIILVLKIFVLIMSLMIVLGLMKSFNLIPSIVRIFSPVLKLMGLNPQVGVLWMTAVVFGLAYGAAVIIQETRENHFSDESLTRLHISIGINHSMVEDPTLFLALGLNFFWLWVPRLITAVLAVQVYNIYCGLKRKRIHAPIEHQG